MGTYKRSFQRMLAQKKFGKPLDNNQILWYNKDVPSKGWTLKEVRTNGMSIGACNPKADMLHASRSVRAIIGKQSEKTLDILHKMW